MSLFATVLLAGAVGAPAGGRGLTLASGGRTAYTIVGAADATEDEKLAARELAAYLGKSTGAEFRVATDDDKSVVGPRILVGPSAASRAVLGARVVDSLGEEELLVRAVGPRGDLALVGGRPRGTLYAVYSFLEKEVGVRWFSLYGDEDVLRHETLRVGPVNRREKPAFTMRDMYMLYYGVGEGRTDYLRRCRANGGNPIGGSKHALIQPGVHSLFYYVNPEEKPNPGYGDIPHPKRSGFFRTNPEFFSLFSEKRVARQLCFSNPELRRVLTEHIEERIRQAGGVGNLSVSAQDTPGEFCQCPACRKLVERHKTPGAPLFDYLVELCTTLRPKYPRIFITTLAYRKDQTEIPPAGMVLPDNLIVVFAPIDDNFAAPMDHPTNAGTLAHLREWRAKAKHVWVWYYPNPYTRAGALPIGNLGRLASDLRLFKQLGVSGFFVEHDTGVPQSHLLADLQTWVLARLLWDPGQDLDALVRDFTGRFYGPAAGSIREYSALLERATSAMPTRMSWSPGAGEYRFLTPDLLTAGQRLFDRAEKDAPAGPHLLRVRQARMSLDRACILFWDRLAALPDTGLARDAIAERYRETFRRTLEARIAPGHRAQMGKYVGDLLETRLRMTPPKPLPAPLDALPAGKARQLFAVEGSKPDSEGAAGVAVSLDTGGELPLTLGLYDAATRRFLINASVAREQIASGAYGLHRVGRSKLGEQCYVWVSRSWNIQVPISECYDPAQPDREWDVYASLRFEGPSYPHGEKGGADRVYLDRVVLVPGD